MGRLCRSGLSKRAAEDAKPEEKGRAVQLLGSDRPLQPKPCVSENGGVAQHARVRVDCYVIPGYRDVLLILYSSCFSVRKTSINANSVLNYTDNTRIITSKVILITDPTTIFRYNSSN